MEKMTKKIMLSGALAVLLGTCLVGCNGTNPLQKVEKKEAANLLVDASIYAEKKLEIQGRENKKGKFYGFCMSGDVIPKSTYNCNDIYSSMVEFFKDSPKYASLSLKHLKDKKFFESIKEDYDIKTFYTF